MVSLVPGPLDPRHGYTQREIEDYNAWRRDLADRLRHYAFNASHNARARLEHDERSKHIAARTKLLWGTGYTGI